MNGEMIGHGAPAATVVAVPELVARAMARVEANWLAASHLPRRSHAENAARCARLAVVEDRRARWWRVLARSTYKGNHAVPVVYGPAVVAAQQSAQSAARFWADTAAYYECRAAGLDLDEQAPGRWLA